MNLQVHLLSRIAVTALVCLLATASLLLYRSDRQAQHDARVTAETLGKQLEMQLLKWGATLSLDNPFPDLQSWQPTTFGIGDCIAFRTINDTASRTFCNGVEPAGTDTPAAFESLYPVFFTAGVAVSRPVVYRNRQYGTLTVAPSAKRELAAAWADISSLMMLSAVMVFSVCALVYWGVSRALAPSACIVAGLREMKNGNLGVRLPSFELNEWHYIAEAVNELASTQQQLLTERQELAVKLMSLQEEERRYLARELHDEFGQCLTGINALSLSIAQGVGAQCPALVDEAYQIRGISQRMLDGIRDLLRRLRPAELDELGLKSSLESLVAGWNTRSQGQTRYELCISGDCAALPEALTVALFRLIQECLTNVAKHAEARHARVALTVSTEAATVVVRDDGRATSVPRTFGVGLLGMRERIGALQGRLEFGIAIPHGFIVESWLPLQRDSGSPT